MVVKKCTLAQGNEGTKSVHRIHRGHRMVDHSLNHFKMKVSCPLKVLLGNLRNTNSSPSGAFQMLAFKKVLTHSVRAGHQTKKNLLAFCKDHSSPSMVGNTANSPVPLCVRTWQGGP